MSFFSNLQAIFELAQGEQDLVEDLKLAKKVTLEAIFFIFLKELTFFLHFLYNFSFLMCVFACVLQAYHDPMLKLSIMTEQELNQIFGTLDSLIPLHEGRAVW